MDHTSPRYTQYYICTEMYETADLIRHLPALKSSVTSIADKRKPLFITGEGSSRIIPAKNVMYRNMTKGSPVPIFTEGATQALEYNLAEMTVVGLSNSGRTRELMRLVHKLKSQNHPALIGITANENTLLEENVKETIILSCGEEQAVAATKSVVEQSLVVEQIFNYLTDSPDKNYAALASAFKAVLDLSIDKTIIDKLARAQMVYFSGRNDGFGEELTLKTNEIVRKKSEFLEGTFGIHGIEEVMQKDEVVILLDPFPEEQQKYYEVFVKSVGMDVIAISRSKTIFETIIIPDFPEFQGYLTLAAGWNLLVEVGLALGIDLDKPVRARKIGNEYVAN